MPSPIPSITFVRSYQSILSKNIAEPIALIPPPRAAIEYFLQRGLGSRRKVPYTQTCHPTRSSDSYVWLVHDLMVLRLNREPSSSSSTTSQHRSLQAESGESKQYSELARGGVEQCPKCLAVPESRAPTNHGLFSYSQISNFVASVVIEACRQSFGVVVGNFAILKVSVNESSTHPKRVKRCSFFSLAALCVE